MKVGGFGWGSLVLAGLAGALLSGIGLFFVLPRLTGSTYAIKDVTPVIASLTSALVATLAIFISMRNTERSLDAADNNARTSRLREANAEEVAGLEALAATFHIPYLVRSSANNNLAQDLRERINDPEYRMLTSLLDRTWYAGLDARDKTIVDEVCATGEKLRAFIEEKAGGVDAGLADHLARASSHFRMLSLAREGKLGSDPGPVAKYVYPTQLDVALEADLDRIRQRIATLRAQPDKDHGTMDKLELPEDAALPAWPSPPRP